MSSKVWISIIVLLAIIIFAMAWILFTTPAHAPTISGTQAGTSTVSTLPSSSTTEPLHAQVTVTTPQSGATVAHSFEVAGTAPGPWFNEAVFPIQVRDPKGTLIAAAQGHAQGEWTTTALVTFTAQVTVDASYKGPAQLVLLKDNESGLPQNDDSVMIPITVQ